MDVNTTDLVLPAGLQDFLEENALICPPIPLAIFPLLEEREENFFATDWSVVSQPLNFNEHWAGNYKVKYWLEPWTQFFIRVITLIYPKFLMQVLMACSLMLSTRLLILKPKHFRIIFIMLMPYHHIFRRLLCR